MPQVSKSKKKVTFARLKAVRREVVYLGTNPDGQELDTPFTAICQYDADEWSYETFSFALSDMTLFQPPGSPHRVLYVVCEKGIVVDLHTKMQETVVPPDSPLRADHRLGYLLKIRQIGDHLYASGSGGQVYRRCDDANWSPLDVSLLDGPDPILNPASELRLALSELRSKAKPSQEEIDRYKKLSREAQSKRFLGIDGLSDSSTYVCCDKSEVYWYGGSIFNKVMAESEDALLAVSIGSEDRVWICGREGTLLRGNHADGFRQVPGVADYPALSSMTWFDGKLYLGSYADPRGLFVYEGGRLRRVRSGLTPDIEDVNVIEAVDGVLWVMGTTDLLRFDGQRWERIDFPANDPMR